MIVLVGRGDRGRPEEQGRKHGRGEKTIGLGHNAWVGRRSRHRERVAGVLDG
jgi:hypothetical protein